MYRKHLLQMEIQTGSKEWVSSWAVPKQSTEIVPSSVYRGNVQFWPLWALSSPLISTIIFLQNVLMFQGQSKGKEASPHLARNSEPQLLGSISLAILIGGGLGHYKPSHHKVVKSDMSRLLNHLVGHLFSICKIISKIRLLSSFELPASKWVNKN